MTHSAVPRSKRLTPEQARRIWLEIKDLKAEIAATLAAIDVFVTELEETEAAIRRAEAAQRPAPAEHAAAA